MNLTVEGKIGVRTWNHYCMFNSYGFETIYIGKNPLVWFLIKVDKFVMP